MIRASTHPAEDPGWHLFDLHLTSQQAHLVHLSEAVYRQASFLDQRVLQFASETRSENLDDFSSALEARRGPGTTPHFIFHLGHCGSTLLSRVLDVSPRTLPVREPLTLRSLVPLPPPVQEQKWKAALDTARNAYSRVYRDGQVPVVKATSTCNRLIAPLLASSPNSRAVLMYVSLETCLAGLLGKAQPAGDLSGHATTRLADWDTIPGAPQLNIEKLDEAGLVVLSWLTGMRHMVASALEFPDQARLLDFENFLANPPDHIEEVAACFGLASDTETMLSGWADVSTGYSKKPDEPYSAFNRRRTLARGRAVRGAEIEAGMELAEDFIRQAPVLAGCSAYIRDQ